MISAATTANAVLAAASSKRLELLLMEIPGLRREPAEQPGVVR
jgi:hypothetical protein